jgi:hypothetical protein
VRERERKRERERGEKRGAGGGGPAGDGMRRGGALSKRGKSLVFGVLRLADIVWSLMEP